MLFNRIIKQNARALKFSQWGQDTYHGSFPWSIIDSENLRKFLRKKTKSEQEERSRILKAQFNMMKKVTKMPTSEPEEELKLKLLKVRLAQCVLSSFVENALLHYLVEGDVNKDIQFQLKHNPVRIDGNILPLFTSENRLRAFYANDNNLSDNVVVHATPGSLFF